MRRGQIVVAAVSGDYGKPRPFLVVQSTETSDLPSVILCPITSDVQEDLTLYRVTMEVGGRTGLKIRSQVMVDKITTVPLRRISRTIGEADEDTMALVTRALAILLGLG